MASLKLDRISGFPWNMIEVKIVPVHVASTGKQYLGHPHPSDFLSCLQDAGTAEHAQANSAFG